MKQQNELYDINHFSKVVTAIGEEASVEAFGAAEKRGYFFHAGELQGDSIGRTFIGWDKNLGPLLMGKGYRHVELPNGYPTPYMDRNIDNFILVNNAWEANRYARIFRECGHGRRSYF